MNPWWDNSSKSLAFCIDHVNQMMEKTKRAWFRNKVWVVADASECEPTTRVLVDTWQHCATAYKTTCAPVVVTAGCTLTGWRDSAADPGTSITYVSGDDRSFGQTQDACTACGGHLATLNVSNVQDDINQLRSMMYGQQTVGMATTFLRLPPPSSSSCSRVYAP